MTGNYEMVVGLEVHVELGTKTKIFCSCPTTFGAEPNTQCCPVCMGMPGTLPVLNKEVVNYAIKAGLATNCTIASYSKQDRKNYFYPDLPKAYQISQYDLPLCTKGYLDIEVGEANKRIGITRIHIEEDAGKLIHDDKKGTLIDCNRCGIPLIEIVSEPDFRSPKEVDSYLKKLRAILIYSGVSNCQMNKGQFRCDVNLSVRKKGDSSLRTRTEIKNINSFQFVIKAIEYEFKRQVEAIEKGEEIIQETRRFDENSGKTLSMRRKEEATDYRFFPDPDLAPIEISRELIEELKGDLGKLPDERRKIYMESYGLTPYDSETLLNNKYRADYFEAAAEKTSYPKLLSNLMQAEVFRLLPLEESIIEISPEYMASIAELLGTESINSSTAKKLINDCWTTGKDPRNIVQEEGLEQINDEGTLRVIVEEILSKNQRSIEDYKNGRDSAFKYLMGQVMAKTRGKANPVKLQRILKEALN
ncbi:Asp-tRNA(Asn)/Glu-tRNA(Gln) amidotransferase subunit GatB [Alloiococcus sp. CFN-8]|uniref:Asp-tRNA(Asn)/Glu-tRNA(Gln) amidotransferase subunit GatB n=1 Tax=Alloiococcus sp. CFN-8 TaxID=3416081 RepID=UPI003CF3CECF